MPKRSASALLRAYLVVGADQLKRETAVKHLKRYLEPGLEDFNLDEVHAGSDTDPSALVSSLQTLPFGSGPRLVIVYEAERLPKPASEAIVSYLEAPNPGSVLCLVAEKMAAGTRLYKAVARQGKSSIVSCSALKRWEMPAYTRRLAKSMGIELTADAAEELVARVGTSTVALDNQLKGLAELVAPRTRIEREDVEANVTRIADVSEWDFADACCARDVTRALRLYRLMRKPSQVYLTSILTGRVRELICAKALDERGDIWSLPQELGRKDWQVKHHATWARGYRMEELTGLLGKAAECERALKGSADSETAFVSFVLAFARQ